MTLGMPISLPAETHMLTGGPMNGTGETQGGPGQGPLPTAQQPAAAGGLTWCA